MTYSPTAVYLMRNEWSASNYKIGMSNHPDRRHLEVEDQYKNVSPRIITTCWFPTTKLARSAEFIWHCRYRNKRSDDHGGKEWFALTAGDVSEFIHWSEHSKSASDIKAWLFRDGASKEAVAAYRELLFSSIPKRSKRSFIDLWVSPRYQVETSSSIKSLQLI